MSNEIKVNPEEMRKAIQQMSNDLAGIEGTTGKIKCEITKNTCKSVVDFGQRVADIQSKTKTYVEKFKQNVASLGQAVNMVEDMDKSLKSAIAGNSTSGKIEAQKHAEQKAKDQAAHTPYNMRETSTSPSAVSYPYQYPNPNSTN